MHCHLYRNRRGHNHSPWHDDHGHHGRRSTAGARRPGVRWEALRFESGACRGRSALELRRYRNRAGHSRTQRWENRPTDPLGWPGEHNGSPWTASGASRMVGTDRRSSGRRSACIGMRSRRRGSDTSRAEQRKRTDQGACQRVHAPTLGAGQPRRDNDFGIVDNFPACGYRPLHPRMGGRCPGAISELALVRVD